MAGRSPGGGYHVKLSELLGPEPSSSSMPKDFWDLRASCIQPLECSIADASETIQDSQHHWQEASLLPTFLASERSGGLGDETLVAEGVLRASPIAEGVLREPCTTASARQPNRVILKPRGVHSLEPGSVQHGEGDLSPCRTVQPESSRPEAAGTVSHEAVHSLAPASAQRQPEHTTSPEQKEGADTFGLPLQRCKSRMHPQDFRHGYTPPKLVPRMASDHAFHSMSSEVSKRLASTHWLNQHLPSL
eukprot:s4278_g3.t1